MSRTRNPHLPLFPDLVIQREVVSHPRIKTSHLIVSEWRIKKTTKLNEAQIGGIFLYDQVFQTQWKIVKWDNKSVKFQI